MLHRPGLRHRVTVSSLAGFQQDSNQVDHLNSSFSETVNVICDCKYARKWIFINHLVEIVAYHLPKQSKVLPLWQTLMNNFVQTLKWITWRSDDDFYRAPPGYLIWTKGLWAWQKYHIQPLNKISFQNHKSEEMHLGPQCQWILIKKDTKE